MDAASLLLTWAMMAQMSGAPAGVPPRLGSGPSQVPDPPPMNGPSGFGGASDSSKPAFGDSTAPPKRPGRQRGTAPQGDSGAQPPFGSAQPPAGDASSPMGGFAFPPADNSGDIPGRLTPGGDNPGPGTFPANKNRGNGRSSDRSGTDRGFVRPQTEDEPFPPAPGSSNVPQRSPTPAGSKLRQGLSPEPPISGPLSPVRHEEPGRLAKSVLSEALNPPPGESLSGQSLSLFDALARSASRVARAEVTKAYWATSAAMADYYIWLDAQQRLKQLTEGARYGGGGGSELAAALASVQAQLREAELVATETRHRLAGYLGDAQLEPICADIPHVGGYRTEFERLFAAKQPPSHLYLIHRTLPLRQRSIELRAEAVRSAREALDAVAAAYARGQAEGRDVLLQLDLYRAARQSFVHEVEQYNDQIGDYAVGIAGEAGDLHNFVALLIRTSTGSSILTPTPQPAANPPTVVPPGSALPPAPNSAEGGEHSILRSRTRLADGRRGDAVRPAVAEEPVERTFVGPTPSSAEPLRKVDPWDEPELQPIETKPPGSKLRASSADAKSTGAAPLSAPSKMSPGDVSKTPSASKSMPADGAAAGQDSGPANKAPTASPAPGTTTSPAKEAAPVKKPAPATDASSATSRGQPIQQVAFRPMSSDDAASLGDVAAAPSDQWAAALAERLHDLPANPLENTVVPAPLRDCLRQVSTPAERRAVIGAFWTAREQAARYQAAVTRGRQMDNLQTGAGPIGNGTRPLGSLMYSALRATAEADEETARVELSAACYQLTVAARQPVSGPWLWPGTRPPAERLALLPAPPATQPSSAAVTQAAIAQRHLETIITGSYALLRERAAAVIKADAARMEVATRGGTRCGLAAPYQWIERQYDETLRFLGALTRYHLAYADYTLGSMPPNAAPDTLAQRLLTSERVRR